MFTELPTPAPESLILLWHVAAQELPPLAFQAWHAVQSAVAAYADCWRHSNQHISIYGAAGLAFAVRALCAYRNGDVAGAREDKANSLLHLLLAMVGL